MVWSAVWLCLVLTSPRYKTNLLFVKIYGNILEKYPKKMLQTLFPRGGISEYIKGSNTNCLDEEWKYPRSPCDVEKWTWESSSYNPISLPRSCLKKLLYECPRSPLFCGIRWTWETTHCIKAYFSAKPLLKKQAIKISHKKLANKKP